MKSGAGTQPEVGAQRTRNDGTVVTTYGSLTGTDAALWYRAMPADEFEFLRRNEQYDVEGSRGYGGITQSRAYCETHYLAKMINDRPGVRYSHLVEFAVLHDNDLVEIFKKVKVLPKAEDGAISLGMGMRQNDGEGGREFNKLLSQGEITWRVVATAL